MARCRRYEHDYKKWKQDFGIATPYYVKCRTESFLKLFCDFVVAVPKSYTKKEREQALGGLDGVKSLYPSGDVDNYLKSVSDALTECGAWVDDRQVVEMHGTKRYGEQDAVIVRIEPI